MDDLGTACENSDDTSNAHGKQTIGVLYWVLERTMSRKSDALGTGAIDFSPLVDIFAVILRCPDIQRESDAAAE